ncbi:TauD/TfdA family dioxygenase [Sorangium sp. So ce321]|uniref:TauD/TfdA family dioxygenase n=1 Tax=Sorangium sp. So ce321 TaxID=3133300 RepID=UPI003F635D1B
MKAGSPRLKSLNDVKRQSIRLSQASLVKSRPLQEGRRLLLVEPSADTIDLAAWARDNRSWVEEHLLRHGGLLFRGFALPDAAAFQEVAAAISPDLLDYVERAAPRSQVAGKVFTSTEYPADQWIPLHHEMSYSHNWPTKLYFYCDVPAEEEGYTPVADDLEIFAKLPQAIKEKFLEKGVMYVRNYGQGADMPWWEVFQTRSKQDVEAYLASTRTEYEWRGQDQLRTRMRRQVTATHPKTGDTVWFNHAHMFHSSNMPAPVRAALRREFKEDELPRNAFYGDGSPIEDEVAQAIRELYRESAIYFSWQKGDVLLLDNFLTSHGRSPFKGHRKIYVAMAELYTNPDFR